MKVYVSVAFLNTSEVVEIAKAADDLGYDGLGIPDHVINLETLKTPYPYTKDGKRRWEAFTDWPDPWVLIGALATVTTRLRFVTTVYLPAMRDPYSAAKSIGTAALLAGGRLELGIGVGWCEEEFTLMGQRFDRRGKRTDEMLELMKELWKPGWTEFDGEFYQTPRLEMEPTPPHIPIYVGGLSDIALRRAARHDGWIGDLISTDQAIERVEKAARPARREGVVDGRFRRHHAADRRVHPGALRPRTRQAESTASSPCRGCSTRDRKPHSTRRSTACASSARTWRWTLTTAEPIQQPAPRTWRRSTGDHARRQLHRFGPPGRVFGCRRPRHPRLSWPAAGTRSRTLRPARRRWRSARRSPSRHPSRCGQC